MCYILSFTNFTHIIFSRAAKQLKDTFFFENLIATLFEKNIFSCRLTFLLIKLI